MQAIMTITIRICTLTFIELSRFTQLVKFSYVIFYATEKIEKNIHNLR